MTVASVVQYSSNVGVSFLLNAGKDGLRVAPHPHALLEANAGPTRRPQGTHNTFNPPLHPMQLLIFIFDLVLPQLRRNTWTLPLPPYYRDTNLDLKMGNMQGSFCHTPDLLLFQSCQTTSAESKLRDHQSSGKTAVPPHPTSSPQINPTT